MSHEEKARGTSRVYPLRKAACLIGSGLHTMQILASFESRKFRCEGRRGLRPRSRTGPCPLPRSYLREDQYSALGRLKPVVDESVARWDLLLLALRARAHARRGVLGPYHPAVADRRDENPEEPSR
jgi:hypothetical protein